MRRTAIILAAVVVMIAGQAHADNDKIRKNPAFGHATCGPLFPCASVDSDVSVAVNAATACVNKYLSVSQTSDLFDSGALDSDSNGNKCLRSNDLPKTGKGSVMTPVCCVVSAGNDMCRVSCDRYAVH